jgi:type II secretory pathway component GspD/PulD (secretin)
MQPWICLIVVSACLTFPDTVQQKPGAANEPYLQFYPVPEGAADIVAIVLQDAFPIPTARVASWGRDRILVWAPANVHQAMAKQKALAPSPALVVETYHLETPDIAKLTDMVRAAFKHASARGPFIGMDETRNILFVRGTPEQNREVREFLDKIGEKMGNPNRRVLQFESGTAQSAAEAIQLLLPMVVHKSKDGKDEILVRLTALGNRLVVETEDREAMAKVVGLVRLMQNTEAGACDFEVLRLKHAKAPHLAKLLDDIYNGPTKSPSRIERIRILADPETNSILFRARPFDGLMLRNLVTKALDLPPTK